MLAQQIDFNRILIVQFGRLQAAYGYDAESRAWIPCSDDIPDGFPAHVLAEPPTVLEWRPVWDE